MLGSASVYFLYNSYNLNTLLSERENEITQYTSRISGLESLIATLQTNLLTLEIDNEELLSQIETLQSQINSLSALVAEGNCTHEANYKEYGNLTVIEAKLIINTNPSLVIIDVRTTSEYDSGHIEGAININVNELESRLDELDINTEYLVYCRLGVRSTRAMSILNDNGFNKIYNMLGGITDWIDAGYPII